MWGECTSFVPIVHLHLGRRISVLAPMFKSRAQQIFSVNILGFVGPNVLVTTTQGYCCSAKVATDNT